MTDMITADTGISLALLITLLGCTITLVRAITGVKRDIADLKQNQYTITAACEHSLRMAIANPNLRIPDPRNPSELISVAHPSDDK